MGQKVVQNGSKRGQKHPKNDEKTPLFFTFFSFSKKMKKPSHRLKTPQKTVQKRSKKGSKTGQKGVKNDPFLGVFWPFFWTKSPEKTRKKPLFWVKKNTPKNTKTTFFRFWKNGSVQNNRSDSEEIKKWPLFDDQLVKNSDFGVFWKNRKNRKKRAKPEKTDQEVKKSGDRIPKVDHHFFKKVHTFSGPTQISQNWPKMQKTRFLTKIDKKVVFFEHPIFGGHQKMDKKPLFYHIFW